MSGGNGHAGQEPGHHAMVKLLGAYVDEELAPEARARVESHLARCEECRRELRAQAGVRARLMAEAPPASSSALQDRILADLTRLEDERAPAEASKSTRSRRRTGRGVYWKLLGTAGWLVAAGIAAFWLLGERQPPSSGMNMTMRPTLPIRVDRQPEPIAFEALTDFQRVNEAALPRDYDITAVEAKVPFSVPALHSAHMRLIAAWTTHFQGEPAAALAYRCHNRLVVQYVVSEKAFFRQPRVRQAIGSAGLYAAGVGKVHAVAWPDLDSGSFLVGEFTPAELAAMRS